MELPVRISVVACDADQTAGGRWRVRWRVENASGTSLRLEDAWVPHGRFRGEGHVGLDAALEPGGSAVVELDVRAEEAPGAVVENAFLILRVRSPSQAWRVFARMRVDFGDTGVARPRVEALTAQPL